MTSLRAPSVPPDFSHTRYPDPPRRNERDLR